MAGFCERGNDISDSLNKAGTFLNIGITWLDTFKLCTHVYSLHAKATINTYHIISSPA